MEILTERLLLREILESDYQFIYELETNGFTQRYESDRIPTKEEIDKGFAGMLESQIKEPRTKYSMLIVRLSDKKTVGRVVIFEIDSSIREWEMGWFIHPHHAGNGYAPEAARALLEYAFNKLNAHRVQALCNDENTSSEKVMIKIGMIKEGTCRGVRLLNNKWYGSHIYSLLDSEFFQNIDQ